MSLHSLLLRKADVLHGVYKMSSVDHFLHLHHFNHKFLVLSHHIVAEQITTTIQKLLLFLSEG